MSEATPPTGYQALPQLATDQDGTGGGTLRNYTNNSSPAFTITVPAGGTVNVPNNTGLTHNDTNYQWNSGKFANRRVNPTLSPECGLNVGLIFDLSGSVSAGELTQMKDAAANPTTGFVASLANTPSSVAVYTFATDAPASGAANTTLSSTSVANAAGVTTVENKINGLTKPSDPNYYTNWDAAFRQVAAGHDLVLILTDGNPTVNGVPGNTSVITTNFENVENGIASANTVKTLSGSHGNKTRIVGVGIGIGANSTTNLAAVSGPTGYNGSNATSADYFTTSFADLGTVLGNLANAQCGARIHVQKLVNNQLTDGWSFSARRRAQPSPTRTARSPARVETRPVRCRST